MSYLSIILLAFALSIDACVVSFSYGLVYTQNRLNNSLKLAFCTGLFQGIMPVIGYFLTGFVKSQIQPYANLIVFLIFTYLGIKFIIESFAQNRDKKLSIDIKSLILIGIATSIDAFSAGITLSLFGNKIIKPAELIAIITFGNSLLGFMLGGFIRNLPTRILEISAGIILILLGLKALL